QGDQPPRSTTTAASARAESGAVAENPPPLRRVVAPQQVARKPRPTAGSSVPAAIRAAPTGYRVFRPPAGRAPSHSAARPPRYPAARAHLLDLDLAPKAAAGQPLPTSALARRKP